MTTDASRTPGLLARTAAIVAAMAALAIVSYATCADNLPSALSPFSFAVVLPLSWGGAIFAMTVAPVLFLFWSIDLISGSTRLPLRSPLLAAIFGAGSMTWFALGWSGGVEYEGLRLTALWAGLSLALATSLMIWARYLRQRATWWQVLMFNFVLFAWPAWCGFPWLGEGP